MPLYDKPLTELITYDPPLTAQPDFDAFWRRAWDEAAAVPVQAGFTAEGETARARAAAV